MTRTGSVAPLQRKIFFEKSFWLQRRFFQIETPTAHNLQV